MRCHWEAISAYYRTLPYMDSSHLRKKGNCMVRLIQQTCFEVLIWSMQLASTSYQLVETVNVLAQERNTTCTYSTIIATREVQCASTQVLLKVPLQIASQDGGIAMGC